MHFAGDSLAVALLVSHQRSAGRPATLTTKAAWLMWCSLQLPETISWTYRGVGTMDDPALRQVPQSIWRTLQGLHASTALTHARPDGARHDNHSTCAPCLPGHMYAIHVWHTALTSSISRHTRGLADKRGCRGSPTQSTWKSTGTNQPLAHTHTLDEVPGHQRCTISKQ